MADVNFKNLKLVDRRAEIKLLVEELNGALNGRGRTIFISGETGIGKTRIVEEIISYATEMGFRIIRGNCIPEHLEPLFPFKTALKKAELGYLLSEKSQPMVISAYLISESGLVITKAERRETDLDPDIFVGMLKAIEAFVKDSMGIIDRNEGTLNSLSYGDYTIMIQSMGSISLAVVIKGEQNEFLIEDMRRTLRKLGERFRDWSGEMDIAEEAKPEVEWFIKSGKYDGEHVARKELQETVFDNIILGLQKVSKIYPLMIFIDDLQWADQYSLNFLYYLSQNIRKNRIIIIGTYRPEDIIPSSGKLHPLEITLNNLAGEGLVRIIGLKRLKRDDTLALIKQILGDFDDFLGNKIYRESGGNPLFVIEIIKLLISENIIIREGNKWKLKIGADKIAIPKKAYEVIKRRLERLSDEEREVLDVASVIGDEFDTKLLSLTTGMDELKILKKLNRIYRKHKLIYVERGKYRFEHSIIREVLYNEILDELRRKYHRIIGDAIYSLNSDNIDAVANLLAHHYYMAGDKRAVEFLMEMGKRAKRNYANDEAMDFYMRALEMADEKGFRGEILEDMGDIMVERGEYEDAEKNYRDAMEICYDERVYARLKRKIAEIYMRKGNYGDALELLQEARKIIGDKAPLEEGKIYRDIGQILFLKGNYENAMEQFKKSLRIFAVRNNKKDIADILKWVGNVEFILGNYEKSKKYYTNALQIMKDIGDMGNVSLILNNIGNLYLILGNLDKSLKIYSSSLRVMENIGIKSAMAEVMNNIGTIHLRRGNLKESLEFYRNSLERGRKDGNRSIMSIALNNIGYVYFLKGEFEEAMNYYKESLKISREMGDRHISSLALLNIAYLYLWRGRLKYSHRIAKMAGETLRESGDKIGYMESLLILGEIELAMGNYDVALKIASELIDIARKLNLKDWEMKGRNLMGMVRRERKELRKAIIEFTKAIHHFSASGDRMELARVYYEYSLLWREKREEKKEMEMLKMACDIYSSMGIKLWEERCNREFMRFGNLSGPGLQSS